jgi:hypothetical protein
VKYLVILPTMVESIVTPCIESLSDSVRENLLVIDNSQDGFAWKFNVESQHHPENIGVARSWNIGARRVVEEKFDYLIILSAAIVFHSGMDDFIERLSHPYGIESQFSYHLIAIGRPTFERIGYFDENFHPAYYEETDFIRRIQLAHISHVVGPPPHLPVVDVHAERQGIALTIKSGALHVDFLALAEYFTEKWGEVPEYETQEQQDKMYQHPFNDPSKPLSYWPERSIEELKRIYKLP